MLFSKKSLMILDYAKPSVVFIKSKAIAESFIKMFESLWKLGEKV